MVVSVLISETKSVQFIYFCIPVCILQCGASTIYKSVMKKIITCFLICISGFSHAQNISIQTAKKQSLTGPVKSVSEKSVMLPEEGEPYELLRNYTEYNKEGNQVVHKFITNIYEQTFSLTSTTYTETQQLLEVNMYEDTTLIETRRYEYDAENRVTKESMYKGNGYLFQKSVFSYDASGNLSEMQLWSSDTYFVLKQLYEYDQNGNRLSLKNYTNEQVLSYEYTYEYGGNNNKTKMVYQKLKSPIIQTTNYTYNKKNELIKLERYDNDKLVHTMEYVYNEQGIVTETINRGISSQFKTVARFDEKGSPIETLEYKTDELTVRQVNSYEYDSQGNWTKRSNSYNGGSPSITVREIVYY